MSIRIGWDNSERTTLRQTFEARWTWDDFETATAALFKMIGKLERPVDVILEIVAPPSLVVGESWGSARFQVRELPPQARTIVVLNEADEAGLCTSFVLLYQLYGATDRLLMLADSLDEARTTIDRHASRRQAHTRPDNERTTAVMPVLQRG